MPRIRLNLLVALSWLWFLASPLAAQTTEPGLLGEAGGTFLTRRLPPVEPQQGDDSSLMASAQFAQPIPAWTPEGAAPYGAFGEGEARQVYYQESAADEATPQGVRPQP